MDPTSSSLLARVRRPADRDAWNRFVELYAPLLFAWARRLGLPPADAADLVQDVFLTLVRVMPSFRYDPGRSFRAWLKTVFLNRHRQLARRPAGAGLPADVPESADDPLDEREYREYLVGRAVRLMEAQFEPATWKACWEVVVAGRPAADVAAELGLTVNAVYLAKSRVLRRL